MATSTKKLFAEMNKETLIDLMRICPINLIGSILKTLESRFLRIGDNEQAISWDNFVAILENIPVSTMEHQNKVLKWVWVSGQNDRGGETKGFLPGNHNNCSSSPGREQAIQLLNMPRCTPKVANYVWQMYRKYNQFGSNDITWLRQIMRKPNLPCAERAAEFLMEKLFRPKLQYSDLVWIIDNYPHLAPLAQKLLNGKYELVQRFITSLS